MSPFGVPLDRLHELAQQHEKQLLECEALTMGPIVLQEGVTEAEVQAFTRFRAIALLKTSFANDAASLAAFIHAVDFAQVRFQL